MQLDDSTPVAALPPGRRTPARLLLAGVGLALLIVAAMGWYTVTQIRQLRDEQTAISERNRKDSLQLLRIQNDLASLGVLMRDMVEGAEPYPMPGWQPSFERLRGDLVAAITLERGLATEGREPAQQERLERTAAAFWANVDRMFAIARAGDTAGAVRLMRGTLVAQLRELDGMVSQFLVGNNRVQEEAARANRAVYDRVGAEIVGLVAVLLIVIAIGGAWIVVANRRAFEEVRHLTTQLRTLSWHTLRLQEDLQRSVSRELHDDFGQILTAVGTLLGRVRRHLPGETAIAGELDDVRTIVQDALERIRTQSQWLHPGVLDDFGLEKALGKVVEQFDRQTGIRTSLAASGPVEQVRAEFAIHIYRIVQEALSNIGRHSGSDRAEVRLTCAGDGIELEIRDHGGGLHGNVERTVDSGLGLVSMRERAELMGGQFRLQRPSNGGLSVEVRVPNCLETTSRPAGGAVA